MKIIKFLLTTIVLIGCLGYGVYYFGTAYASEKVMDVVSTELDNNGQLEEVKEFVNNDPDIQKFIAEGATIDESNLPFTTKEEAVRKLVPKFGLSELQEIQTKAQQGMSANEQQALLAEIEQKLTPDEIAALKLVIYKELNK